jgi:lysophospholipase L1-like esterase
MIKTFIHVLLVMHLVGVVAWAAEENPLVDAVECNMRGGLPNFLARVQGREEVRVAYIGGSITAANGWRPQTTQWLKKQYPDAKIVEIDAAIGGTGSDLGVFRFRQDVLRHRPQLIFVEFAVNDGGAPPEQIHRCMEGMVRQAWKQDPTIDLCFVYTLVDGMVPTLAKGKLPRSASAMESVAGHYGIPSIHMGLEVVRQAQAGQMILKADKPVEGKTVFSSDGVHPHADTGHRLYTEAVARSMERMKGTGRAGPHAVGNPLVADNYEQAQMVPLEQAKLGEGWKKLDGSETLAKRFGKFLPDLYAARAGGTAITFRFKGTAVGFYDLLGPDCGQLVAEMDGGPASTVPRFDSYCTYHRLGSFFVGRGLPEGVHTVVVKVDSTMPDKPAILAKRQEKMDDPKRFEGTTWYAGWVLLIGEPVD